MTDGHMKKVIVVLSAGRSGTSLLMNVLGKLGMSLSENLIPGSLENPEGYFEDADIVEIHKQLFLDLKTKPTLPLPAGWQGSGAAGEARKKINSLITERLGSTKTIWGFKDPRTCSFLPLWARVFNPAKVVPTFVLAVRNPASVVTSFMRQYNDEESLTELMWLQRNCDALYHTAADCFILHYEEWFAQPGELVRGLLDYTGLSEFSDVQDLDEVLQGLIKPNLNRAQYEDYSIQNQYVAKLYAQLRQCHGSDFDRNALMEVVKECRGAMEQFKGWADVADTVATRSETRVARLEKRIEQFKHEAKEARVEAASKEKQLSVELASIQAHEKNLEKELNKAVSENYKLTQQTKDQERELEKAVLENNKLLQQVKDLFEEVKNLRCSVKSASGKIAAPRRVEKQRVETLVRNTSSPQLREFIMVAKRRVARLFPGLYSYYKTLANTLRI